MEDVKSTLLEILKQQAEQWKNYEQRLEKLKELFVEQQREMLTSNKNEDLDIFSQDTIINVIAEFNYMPEEEVTFLSYFCRYKDLYKTDCSNWPNHKKVRLILRKLGTVEHMKFVNYILPKKLVT